MSGDREVLMSGLAGKGWLRKIDLTEIFVCLECRGSRRRQSAPASFSGLFSVKCDCIYASADRSLLSGTTSYAWAAPLESARPLPGPVLLLALLVASWHSLGTWAVRIWLR